MSTARLACRLAQSPCETGAFAPDHGFEIGCDLSRVFGAGSIDRHIILPLGVFHSGLIRFPDVPPEYGQNYPRHSVCIAASEASTANSVHPRASGDPETLEASVGCPGSPLARGRTGEAVAWLIPRKRESRQNSKLRLAALGLRLRGDERESDLPRQSQTPGRGDERCWAIQSSRIRSRRACCRCRPSAARSSRRIFPARSPPSSGSR
jgi:hypothetical protein